MLLQNLMSDASVFLELKTRALSRQIRLIIITNMLAYRSVKVSNMI